MSSETSELTFVRCPSCRSLVPATATRCRICNSQLDGEAKGEDAESSKNSRVRQKTISATSDDLDAALALAESAEHAEQPASIGNGDVDAGDTGDATADGGEDFDPLGAYLKELDDSDGRGGAKGRSTPDVVGTEDDEDLDPLGLDLLDEDPEPAPAKSQKIAQAPVAEVVTHTDDVDPRDPLGIEVPEPRRTERSGGTSARAAAAAPAARAESRRADPPREKARAPREDRSESNRPARAESAPAARQQQSERPVKSVAGRLFGWLVSYENPDGRAIELREGRFFVTGTRIRPTDLVIEDASVSTPHALMSVSSESGLRIQDLMSERGLFVRYSDGGPYKRDEGTVDLAHGDWIRFGDVEFLVVIVPASKR